MKKLSYLPLLATAALLTTPGGIFAQERNAANAGAATAPGTEARQRENARPDPSSPEAARRRAALFGRLDANNDGTLTREEFDQMGNRQRPAGPARKNARKGKRTPPAATTTTTTTAPAAETEKNTPAKPEDPRPAAEVKKEPVEPNSAEKRVLDHTRTTGSTGGTGSSASGPTADGTTQTGTTEQKP